MSESNAWVTMRKYLLKKMHTIDIQRIEDKLMTGIPDVNCCWRGKEFWLEGKNLDELPVRDTTKVKVGLRQDQLTWLLRRRESGGIVLVWVRVKHVGWWIFTPPYFEDLVNGIEKSVFMSHSQFFKTTDEAVDWIKDHVCLNL